jgi:hypothetical protein
MKNGLTKAFIAGLEIFHGKWTDQMGADWLPQIKYFSLNAG